MPQYSAQPTLPWSIPQLSTAHLFGVTVPILTLSTSLLKMPCDSTFLSHTNRQPFYLIRHPTEICCQKAVLSLAHHAQEPKHLLYERLLCPLGGQLQQLKSRHSFLLLYWNCRMTLPRRHQCSTMGGI